MPREFEIAGRPIGANHPPYIVAELSANHGGSIERAIATIREAKHCGADAVKLQTYTPDTITIDHDGPDFCIEGGLWDKRSLYELYKEAHTPWDWHAELFAVAKRVGIDIFSTPFDNSAVELLSRLGAPAIKIASFEIVDHELIACVARTKKPTIMSTGMSSMVEIGEAVETFRSNGGEQLMLLHCISGYPTPVDQSNLTRIRRLEAHFGLPVGLSDHTLGTSVAIAAVAVGARFIEKHFTLARADGGPDSSFSLEPVQLRALTQGAREAFEALGDGSETRAKAEMPNIVFRRSLYVVKDVAPGDTFDNTNVRAIRPGYGLAPKELSKVIGRKAAVGVKRGTRMSWHLLADPK
jgi:pseudaminic acid synthase